MGCLALGGTSNKSFVVYRFGAFVVLKISESSVLISVN